VFFDKYYLLDNYYLQIINLWYAKINFIKNIGYNKIIPKDAHICIDA